MPVTRRHPSDDATNRDALLDAAEQLMLDKGYAAVTSRRVAAEAGVAGPLVHYYFGTMDELFVAIFRRSAEQAIERLIRALSSRQPLWGLWEISRDYFNTSLLLEFNALARHRETVRAEIAACSQAFRQAQLDAVGNVLQSYGAEASTWQPSAVVLLMSAIARLLLVDEACDIHIGHAELVDLVERHIKELEGERRPTPWDEYIEQRGNSTERLLPAPATTAAKAPRKRAVATKKHSRQR